MSVSNFQLSLSNVQPCDFCNISLGENIRIELSEQIQKIYFSNSALPCIEIAYAVHVGFYCTDAHAIEVAEMMFQSTGTQLSWPDIQPVVPCSICNADFKTDSWHTVMTMTVERGDLNSPEILDAEDLARVCPACAPVDANPEFSETGQLFFGPAALVNSQCKNDEDAEIAE